MKMNLKEMKTLYTFGCPNREATVERLRYVAALTPDPAAKKLFYMLSVKLSDEKCDKWYRRFYYNLRLQMQEYYQHKAVIMDSYWNHHIQRKRQYLIGTSSLIYSISSAINFSKRLF